MQDSANPDKNALSPKGLTRSQTITVWVGLIGAAIGCSSWMLAMAGMGKDWMAFGLTAAVDIIMVYVFAKLSLRNPSWRFPLLAAFITIITAHSLGMYWWRYELWRGGGVITPEKLLREKEIITLTIVAMVAIILAQFLLIYFLQANSRKNRAKMRKQL